MGSKHMSVDQFETSTAEAVRYCRKTGELIREYVRGTEFVNTNGGGGTRSRLVSIDCASRTVCMTSNVGTRTASFFTLAAAWREASPKAERPRKLVELPTPVPSVPSGSIMERVNNLVREAEAIRESLRRLVG